MKWESCSNSVGSAMSNDERTNSGPKLVDLLNNGIKVLLYHGELDFSCNWVGGEKAIDGVEWYAQNEWLKTKFKNVGYGLARNYQNLWFIKFSAAGHMVPQDQPENSLKMLDWFMNLEYNL